MTTAWPRRRVAVVAASCALPVLATVVWLFASAKTFVATGVVRVEPVWVAALTPAGPLTGTAEEARREQARAAREDLAPRLESLEQDFAYTVTPVGADSFRFDIRAGAPEDALGAAGAVVNAFAASRNDGGAVQAAIDRTAAELAEVEARLATPDGAADPALAERRTVLQEQLRVYEADAEAVASVPAAVVEAPERPTEPASPAFVPLLAAAAVVGVLCGVAAAWRTRLTPDHARDPGRPSELPSAPAPGPRGPLGAALGVAAVLLLLAGASGLHSLWELRPDPGARTEAFHRCIDRWLASVPEGSSIHVDSDPFWIINIAAAAHPRLEVAPTADAADVRLGVVLEYEDVEGELPCGGYKLVRS